MTICDGLGWRRAGSAALAQFIVLAGGSADLRWALVALVLRSVTIIGGNCRVLLVSLAQTAARRFAGKVGFPRHEAPADTTLAAGGR